MARIPLIREIPELPDEIIQAALDGDLVLFVGAGTSRLLGLPSWGGMARMQLEYLRTKGALNYSELDQLSGLDAKKQLSIAFEVAVDNKLELNLTSGLKDNLTEKRIYESINEIGCVCVTTNYDELLAPRYTSQEDGSVTPISVNRIYRKSDFLVKHLDTPGTVIHLHGSVSDQATMIVTTKNYLEHYDDPFVQEFLGDLFSRKTILFLGYGLEEAEILEHILRRGRVSDIAERRRFVLQGYYRSQDPLYENLYKYYRKSFGVHVIAFDRDHNDYKQQESILSDWASKIIVNCPPLVADMEKINEVLGNG